MQAVQTQGAACDQILPANASSPVQTERAAFDRGARDEFRAIVLPQHYRSGTIAWVVPAMWEMWAGRPG